VILIAVMLLALITVPLAGGRLIRIADMSVKWGWAILIAIGLQIFVISFLPDRFGELPEWLHVLSYFFAALFVLANIRVPGMVLIGLGALCNFVAILANNGVMPASAAAQRGAGLTQTAEGFANSATVEDPKLLFLGDIFYIPDSVPILDNVFSIGDVLIAVGLVILIHGVCGSRLVPERFRGSSSTPAEDVA
jgi:hypothetical protein